MSTVFQASEGKSEASEKLETRATSRMSLSLYVLFAFASARLKNAIKTNVCYAGHLQNSVSTTVALFNTGGH